jgi:hypothetical protein
MFGVSGYGLHYVKRFANDGKKARWNRDLWDRVSQFIPGRPRSELLNIYANSSIAK